MYLCAHCERGIGGRTVCPNMCKQGLLYVNLATTSSEKDSSHRTVWSLNCITDLCSSVWLFYVPTCDSSMFLRVIDLGSYVWMIYVPACDSSVFLRVTELCFYMWLIYVSTCDWSMFLRVTNVCSYVWLIFVPSYDWPMFLRVTDLQMTSLQALSSVSVSHVLASFRPDRQ